MGLSTVRGAGVPAGRCCTREPLRCTATGRLKASYASWLRSSREFDMEIGGVTHYELAPKRVRIWGRPLRADWRTALDSIPTVNASSFIPASFAILSHTPFG